MTLAEIVLLNVAKLRDLQTTSSETGDEWIDEADVERIAADLEFAARQPCEQCEAYKLMLKIRVEDAMTNALKAALAKPEM